MVDKWVMYILKCNDGTLYTGVTNNIEKRLNQHSRGKGSKYTRSRLPVELIYQENCGGRSEAMKREYAVKLLSKNKKQDLIESKRLNGGTE